MPSALASEPRRFVTLLDQPRARDINDILREALPPHHTTIQAEGDEFKPDIQPTTLFVVAPIPQTFKMPSKFLRILPMEDPAERRKHLELARVPLPPFRWIFHVETLIVVRDLHPNELKKPDVKARFKHAIWNAAGVRDPLVQPKPHRNKAALEARRKAERRENMGMGLSC